MDTAVRPYAPTDFESLYALDQACFSPGISYSKRDLREYLRIPSAECLVADVNNEVAGFILTAYQAQNATIITLDVAASFRRRGVGTTLLAAAERNLRARAVQRIEIQTSIADPVAVAFWEHHGYRTRGILRRYYNDQLDAYTMVKSLS